MTQEEEVAKSIEYRGKCINQMTILENQLNIYLSAHFCGGKNVDRMLDAIILLFGDERMSLMNKVQVLKFIGTNYDKSWYEAYQSSYGDMNKDLIHVVEHRNLFAHRILEFTPSHVLAKKQEDSVRFIRYKNNLAGFDFNDEKFNDLIAIIDKLWMHLALINGQKTGLKFGDG